MIRSMRFVLRTVSVLLLFILIKCTSPTERINDAFKTVAKSQDNSNIFLSNSIKQLYFSIDSTRQSNMVLALKADSVYYSTDLAVKFIDSLKRIMQLEDTSGTDLDVAARIFIQSPAGDTLKDKLLDVYNHSYSSVFDTAKEASLDSALSLIAELHMGNEWKIKYFGATSTMSAITVLNHFKLNCNNAAMITLRDIKERCGGL